MKLVKRSLIPLVLMLFISMFMAFPIFPAAATPLPVLEARPAVIEVPEEGADVAIEIWVTDVAEDWEIIGFQFSVPYVTEWLAPAPFVEGTFMEAFVNNGEQGPLYAAVDIPSAPTWSVTMAMVLILPDPDAGPYEDLYHAPFPSGEGRLITLHYTALGPGVGMSMDIDFFDIIILDRDSGEVPYEPLISATIDLDPDTLNLKSKGRWFTAYIELPESLWYSVSDIDVSSIMLNGTIPVDPEAPQLINDYDEDGVPDLMVKFSRSAVSEFILSKGITYGDVTLTLAGQIYGEMFEGSDVIKVRMPGDINIDGIVDMWDIGIIARAFGSNPKKPRWNYVADENEDNKIDMKDMAIAGRLFGTTY